MAELPEDIKQRIQLIEEASKSIANYNKLLTETRAIQVNVNHLKERHAKITSDLKKVQDKINKTSEKTSADTIKKLEEEEGHLKDILDITEENLEAGKKGLKIRRDAVKEVSLLNAGLDTTLKISKKIGKFLKEQARHFVDQQKAVKETELSMGVLSNQANGFRNNLYRAATNTNQLGVSTKDLAKIQGTYSDNVGRAVQLSEEELENMAALAKGTMMGAEGAAEFAAQMEKFNISAEGSVDYIQDVVDMSQSMGTNSGKVIKNIQKNIGLLNRYNFEEGVKGLGKMANLATKFKFEMQDIATLAEKVMTPEGAVDVAAQLQVLGGEWAKLGDPFELMYRSRNDLVGLQEDIINATKATARFDEATGEVMIDPMEMHRLREVANATGITFDSLANSAKEAAKFDRIQSGISNIFNQKDKDFLASMAKFDKKTGQFKITMQTEEGDTVTENVKALRKITPAVVQSQRELKQSLEARAKQAITFDETLVNLKNTFKTLLFPGFESFATALQSSVGDFHKWAVDSGAMDTFRDFGKQMGEFAGFMVKIIANNPFKAAAALLIGKAAMWVARGRMLGMGFNQVTAGRFGGGGGTGRGGGAGGAGGGLSKGAMARGRNIARYGKTGGKAMNFAKGAGKIAAPLAALGVAIDGFTNLNDDNMGVGEGLLKTLDQNKYMAMGATIGSIIPGLGTIAGAGIGGIADMMVGDDGMWGEYGGNSKTGINPNNIHNDFIARPGKNPVSFSPDDTVVGAKKGGPIDKMIEGSTRESTKNTGGSGNNKLSVEFKDSMKIEGSIDVNSSGNTAKIDLNDPILMRDLSKVIMEELSRAISGGKIGSNPVSVS